MVEKPTILDDLDNFPEELREQPQWIVWRWANRDGKLQKWPTDPRSGAVNASDKDPDLWMSFADAVSVARSGVHDICGVGFCFSDGLPYCGVDLDDCRDPATGEIQEWAREIIRELDSYTEVSPSGTGVKIYCRGVLPRSGKRAGVEMYDHLRFFTVTGWHLEGTRETVRTAQKELVALSRRVFGDSDEGVHGEIPDPVSPALDDSEVLEKLRDGKRADKFKRLWEGDLSDHDGDHSAADLALCGMVAFYTQDPVQLDRLFRGSGLMRPKWDDRHRGDGANYGEMTVGRALRGRKPEDCWMGKEITGTEPGLNKGPDGDQSRLRRRNRVLGERRDILKIIREGVTPPEPLAPGLEDLMYRRHPVLQEHRAPTDREPAQGFRRASRGGARQRRLDAGFGSTEVLIPQGEEQAGRTARRPRDPRGQVQADAGNGRGAGVRGRVKAADYTTRGSSPGTPHGGGLKPYETPVRPCKSLKDLSSHTVSPPRETARHATSPVRTRRSAPGEPMVSRGLIRPMRPPSHTGLTLSGGLIRPRSETEGPPRRVYHAAFPAGDDRRRSRGWSKRVRDRPQQTTEQEVGRAWRRTGRTS